MRIFEFDTVPEDYIKVTGISTGVSAKNNNRPYVFIYGLVPIFKDGKDLGFKSEQLFFWTDRSNPVIDYCIAVNDSICPFYVGSGDFKKLKNIDVIKSKGGK